MDDSQAMPQGTKKLFWKLGTCSRTFFYILNREFGEHREAHEQAADPLAGGILQQGYQCGIIWGAALGVGAEALRQSADLGAATGLAITATQHLLDSFTQQAGSADCLGIIHCRWTNPLGVAKYFLTGKIFTCFNLAEDWAPEALQAAREGLSQAPAYTEMPCSCASEVARRMGASEEEQAMVAGFAGGLGLSGNGCGALAAAMWMNTLAWGKESEGKTVLVNPKAKATLQAFSNVTGGEFLCQAITGQRFESLDAHTAFIQGGGCDALMQTLAQS